MDGVGAADTGEAAARARVERIYASIDRLGREALWWTVLAPRDPVDRRIRLAALETAVDRAGRRPLLDEARRWLHEALGQRLSSRGRQPEVGVWGMSDVGRGEDVAAVRLALDDIVSVAVALDLVEPEDAAVLAEPGCAVLGLAPLPGLPEVSVQRPGGWEPSEADWAAAAEGGVSAVDDGDEETEPEGPDAPGGSEDRGGATGPPRRARIATLLVAAAVILAGIVLLVTGNVAFAFLAALAVGALGWSTKVGPRRE